MSETPRTDAKEKETQHRSIEDHAHYGWKFADQLERELAAVTRERDEAQRDLNHLADRGASMLADFMETKDQLDALRVNRDYWQEECQKAWTHRDNANAAAEAGKAQIDALRAEVERLRAAIKGQVSLLPLLPGAPPGTYARGYDSGMRDTITAISAALQEPSPSAPSKEWCANMAKLEGDSEIGAGPLAMLPQEPTPCRLGCLTECQAKVHGCASECPALPWQPKQEPTP